MSENRRLEAWQSERGKVWAMKPGIPDICLLSSLVRETLIVESKIHWISRIVEKQVRNV